MAKSMRSCRTCINGAYIRLFNTISALSNDNPRKFICLKLVHPSKIVEGNDLENIARLCKKYERDYWVNLGDPKTKSYKRKLDNINQYKLMTDLLE